MIQEKAFEMALLCCMLYYAVGRKDDRLAKLIDERRRLDAEINRMKDVIDDRDLQLLENNELIQSLSHKQGDGNNEDDGSSNR